ncbi:MAG: hypothetical protein IJS14_01865 [Lentisphaeria bacterium]|nr:hypothetical protein [Lentisphaeria bacterium]
MKRIGMCVCLALTAGLLTDCATAPESAEKPAEKTAEKAASAPVQEKKAVGPQEVKKLELDYLSALQEKNPAKRKARFREVRARLLAAAETANDPKIHLLLGYMAELGQGMQFDGILAAQHYRKAANAGLPEAKIALAEFWRRNGLYLDEAAKQIQSIPDHRSRPAALCSLGMIYYTQGKYDQGFEYLKLAYHSKTANVRGEVMKIMQESFEQSFKDKKFDAAMKELLRMQSLEPDNFLVPQLMGLVEFSQGHLAEAEKHHLRAWKLNPAFPDVYRDLARIRLQTGRKEQALEDAKVAYAVSGHDREMGIFLLSLCAAMKEYDQTLRLIDEMLRTEPGRIELQLLRADVLVKTGKIAESSAELKKLSHDRRMVNNLEFWKSYAGVASLAGDHLEAVKANERVLKKTFDPIFALNLAELYIITDQYDKAIGLLARPEFKEQTGTMERCVIPYLKACALLAVGKDAGNAIRQFKEALPAFLETKKKSGSEWDVAMFRKWLAKAALSEEVKKSIAEMTDVFAQETGTAAKKTEKDVKAPAGGPQTKPEGKQ